MDELSFFPGMLSDWDMARDLERIGIASYRGKRVYFLASIAYYDELEDVIHRTFHVDEK